MPYNPPRVAAERRTDANIGLHEPNTLPLPRDWHARLLGYIEAGHIRLSPARWSVAADAPQHQELHRQLSAADRATANAVDAQLRTWIDNGVVRLDGEHDQHGEQQVLLAAPGYALIAELHFGRRPT